MIFIIGAKNSREMMKKTLKSQITTILIFIMAVLFLFALITINISRISQKKTTINNIADTVGLRLASQLGSMANALKSQFEIWGGKLESCEVNWKLMIGGLLAIAAIAAAIAAFFTAGTSAVLALKLGILAAGFLMGAVGFGYFGVTQQFTASNLGAQENLKLKFKSFSTFQQITESPVSGVLFSLVDDPALVKDEFDMDRDNDKEDYIPRFFKWYISRLNSFVPLVDEVKKFYDSFFHSSQDQDNPVVYRFAIIEDDKTKMVMKRDKKDDPAPLPDSDDSWWVDWWVDVDGDKVRETKLASWFRNDLRSMLTQMRQYGYGINVRLEEDGKKIVIVRNKDEYVGEEGEGDRAYEEVINIWIAELRGFEYSVAKDLHDIDFDTAVQGLDAWLNFLIFRKSDDKCPGDDPKENKNQDWYTRLGTLKNYALVLRDKLSERKNQIHTCIENCMTITYQCCSCCSLWRPKEKRTLLAYNQAGLRSTCDGGTGILSSPVRWLLVENGDGNGGGNGNGDGDGNGDGNGDGDDECSPSYGCCGPEVGCGQYCDQCGSANSCTTYTPSGSTNCCNVLPLEPYCSNNIVDRYKAIEVLTKFIQDVDELLNLITNFYTVVDNVNKDTYKNMHEAFYLWVDYVGGTTSEKREVAHIAYAKIEGLDPSYPECFKFPSIKHRSTVEWYCPPPPLGWRVGPLCFSTLTPWGMIGLGWIPVPKTCVAVRNAVGEFTLTVARFDEEESSKKSPLERFWRFRLGRGTTAKAEEEKMHEVANRFKDAIDAGSYVAVTDEAEKQALTNILKNYGIVSKIKVHYGPGVTPEEGKTVPAAEKNKDIYIEWTSSDFDRI